MTQQFSDDPNEDVPMGGVETGGGASQHTTLAGRAALLGAAALGGLLLLMRSLEARRRTQKN
ncbi:hypothetical protein [Rhizocola hellebori]|uniref:hypothetical protein n=1 Tax=Rhizocola hellebori TaxID=1392758 RepID=UPI0019448A14|nr:hypothetical protein [Rhizocola hellebori]